MGWSGFRKLMKPIDKAIDNNSWLRIASTALGGEVWRTGIRQLQDKKLSDWDSNDWKQMADSVSAYRQYRAGERSDRHADTMMERYTQRGAETAEDALVGQINRAYGVDESDDLDGKLSGWEKELTDRLAQPSYRVFGREREMAQQQLQQLKSMRAEVGEARKGSPADMARQAIEVMSNRSGASAKRAATRELDDRLAGTVAQRKASAYTRGVQGSSFDRAAQAATAADYVKGRAGIHNEVATADRDFRSTVDKQRQDLVTRVRSGAVKSMEGIAANAEQQNAASKAYDNLTERAIGRTLATGSDLALNDVVQRRRGNMGWAGTMPQRSAPRSRSTFGTIS